MLGSGCLGLSSATYYLCILLNHSLLRVFLFKMRLVIIVSEGLNELILRKYLEQSMTQHKHGFVMIIKDWYCSMAKMGIPWHAVFLP